MPAVVSSLLLLLAPTAERPARFGDLAAYWIAGRSFIEGKNNHDPDVVAEVEQREGLSQAFVIRNPPWIYPLLVPFGLVPFTSAGYGWLIVNLLFVIGIGRLLAAELRLSLLAAAALSATFLPTLICLGFSQWSIVVLLGAVMADHCWKQDQPFRSGLWLVLCSLKPHIVCLVWLAPMVTRKWRSALLCYAGLLTGIVALLIPTLWQRPQLWEWFRHGANDLSAATVHYLSATIGMWLRVKSGMVQHAWVQFAPFVISVGVMILWSRRRPILLHGFPTGLLLLIGSVLAMPYGWHYDQAVLLPVYLWCWGAVLDPRLLAIRHRRLGSVSLVIFEVGQVAMLRFRAEEAWYVVWPIYLTVLAFGLQWEMALAKSSKTVEKST